MLPLLPQPGRPVTIRDVSDQQQLNLRRATDDDFDQIVEVCGAALQWSGNDDDASFFDWKHRRNPFGPSPIWIAEVRGSDDRTPEIVGVRAMMRWEFHHPDGGVRRMARAVDTATLPSHQGQGIFSRLTKAAVEGLTDEGVSAVFNTPNDKSRPGYLKLGWTEMGRVPIAVRPRGPRALLAMARSRVAAERWGLPTPVGLAPADALADTAAVEAAIAATPAPTGWATPLSPSYLAWRTSFEPLACRVAPLETDMADGFVVFRLRRRGALVQLSILHAVAPEGRSIARTVGRLLRSTGADLAMASSAGAGNRMIPVPSIGPLLTWRTLADPATPPMSELDLPLGTIELF